VKDSAVQSALARYRAATREQEQVREEAERQATELQRKRARALADMYAEGMSYRQIGATVGLSAPRIQQLVATHYKATATVQHKVTPLDDE
jgi:DNA-directed RNA polymerase specialized sigma24 family protein